MKVGIIGTGKVGSACALSIVLRGSARELILVDRTRKRAKGVALDVRYGAPLAPRVDIRDGDYEDLAGSAVVIVTVGVNEKTGGATDRRDPEGRLRLLDTNAGIYKDIIPKVVHAVPEALLLIVTDPPDPLADLARALARHDRVLSTGTFLDSLRFRVHLARHLEVSPADVDAQILGEHGKSAVFLWSTAHVAGVPVLSVFERRGRAIDRLKADVESEVRDANIAIIEGNEASQFGIAIVVARIVEMVLRDERAVIPIGSHVAKYGVTLSLPSVVGRGGVLEVLEPEMSDDEREALARSAETLRSALRRSGAGE